MHKNIAKDEIVNYFVKQINEIDIHFEKLLSNDTFTSDQKININQERELIISKINEIERVSLACLNFEPFCFFVLNDSLENKKDLYFEMKYSKFIFQNEIGKLIILKTQIDHYLVEEIKKTILENSEPETHFFDSFTELLKYNVILKLVKNKFNDLIIDLSKPEVNSLKRIEFSDDSERFKRIKLKNIEFLQLFINPSLVEFLRTEIDEMYPFPDYLDFFQNLKTLEIYKADWKYLPSNVFLSLKQLESLILESVSIESIEKDAFKGLKKLKKLSLIGSYIESFNRNMFEELENLEEFNIINWEKIEGLDINCLTSLRHLYLVGRRNKLVLNSNFFKYCCNLTAIDLEDSLINHLPADIFSPIKCLKYLNVSNDKCLSNDDNTLINFDFLEPLNNLEYLKVTLNDHNLVNIDSTYFNSLDNLDNLETISYSTDFFNYSRERGEYFIQLFDKKKNLEFGNGAFLTVCNKDAEIDLYSELSDESKKEIIKYKSLF
ncbi:unnamed protein product [Brachionus calyciflorus]|uniref:Uncharacterized protein n=1 Tax=Brachionus calyciflorus TaxID=104777 RepID=A0A814K3A6_9BILA|nr:unnamed protein product [Brachionus calyciflorus]